VSSQLSRTFVLRGEDQARALHAFLKMNASAMATQGQPLEVQVRVWKPRASDAQRALIWIVNEQIAQQAWIAGRRFDAETWHEQAKRELLPEETRKGVKKWRFLPNGERELNMSTEHLDREEKTAYIDALMAYAGSLGVTIKVEAHE
jgi:hypothetical protein